jgi:adenine-specific DNA-methyltransferase
MEHKHKQLAFTEDLHKSRWEGKEKELENELRKLFSYNQEEVNFSEEEINLIIKELNNCKILDPACGSGAFPMGILHKMVHVLKKIDPNNTKWEKEQKEKTIGDKIKELEEDKKSIENLKDEEVRHKAIKAVEEKLKEIEEVFRSENNFDDYSRKLYLIENCIYGVDIQPIATQISKLRFFISLIVDQISDKNKDNFGIRPLPNLETKFVASNTLIGIEKPKAQMDIFSLDEELNKLEKELKDNRHKLFSAKSPATKKRLREKDKELREKMSGLLIKTGLSPENAKKLASWDPYNQNVSSEFFDMEWMFGIHDPSTNSGQSGFDVIIGNPPYVQIQSFSGKQEQKDWQNQKYETFSKMGDLYSLFYEKGNMILKEKGLLCFITSNKWMRAGYGENTRKYFAEKTNPLLLVDFGGYKVFESATVDTNILVFEKYNNKINNSLSKGLQSLALTKTKACAIQKDFNSNEDINEYVTKNGVILEELSSESWIILSKKEFDIKKRIESIGTPLKDWDISINYGIKTGFNEAFIIDGKKKDELIQADPKNAEIIKPILRGRDIKKYKAEFADLWIIFIPWHFPLHNDSSIQGNSLKAEEEFKIQYPSLYKHFESYKIELSSRNKTETGIRYEWYVLQRFAPTYYKDFDKEKIVYPNMTKYRPFVLDKNKFYTNQKCFIITSEKESVRYLISILNSWVFDFAFKDYFPELLGGTRELSKVFFVNLPIPKISEEDMKPFEILVDFIIYAKENGFDSESNTFESVIDGLVYDLYFPEEMKKGGCYITDRIKETLKPFDSNDTEDEKKEYIQAVYKFCNADKIIYGGLIHRRSIDIVKVITGNNNE